MPKSLTARFESTAAARNAKEDLIASGYPTEKVYFQGDVPEVKVITPAETQREPREILGRHDPIEITETDI